MPGKARQRPRPWLPLDIEFFQQDTIGALLDEFGCAGPMAFLHILCEARKSDLAGLRPISEQGRYSFRTAALAHTLRTTSTAAGAIVSRCVDLGLLAYLDGTDLDAGRVVVRSLKREAWEVKDATAAARQAHKRQREEAEADGDDPDADYLDC